MSKHHTAEQMLTRAEAVEETAVIITTMCEQLKNTHGDVAEKHVYRSLLREIEQAEYLLMGLRESAKNVVQQKSN